MGLFSLSDNNYLGIDIGESSIKMVELVKKNKKIVLSNYGFSDFIPNFSFSSSSDIDYLAGAVVKLKNELGIKTNKATVSLPSFSVFSSVINVYDYDKKKMNERIIEEAKKVIPLPLDEMVLDWKVIPRNVNKSDGVDFDPNNIKIFLTGSPKKLIKKYIDVFKRANIFLSNLETETFSLIRSLLGGDFSTVMMIEMGANSTDFSIIKDSIPFLNRSINISGKNITDEIATKMGLSADQAEQFKLDLSLSGMERSGVAPKVLLNVIEPITNEIKYMSDLFIGGSGGRIEKIILSGGGSMLFNFPEYLENIMNIKVVVGDPWFRVSFPLELKAVLDEVGPRLGVAVGLALRGID